MERRPIKSAAAAPDGDKVAAANGGDDEITINDPLPVRLAELEKRISAALTGEWTAHHLANLLMQCDLAVPQAEEFGKAELERALDPLQSPDPREARQAAEDATFASNRLRTLRPRLLARYHEVSAAEQREQYLGRYTDLKREGAVLAQELADLYPSFVGPLVGLFGRLRGFRERCRALHVTDPGGLPHVDDPELKARRLGGFTGEVPSLLDSVRLPDFTSGRELWPEKPPSFAASFAASMVPQHPGAAWCSPEYLEARHAERVAEQEKMARHYETQAAEQESRENKTLRENWEASQRRS